MAEDQASGPGRPAGTRMLKSAIVATVVAVLVVSALAVAFYSQAQDYRGAKYRAQFVLVSEICQSVPSLNESIDDIVDDLLDNGFRRSAAMFAQATADGLSGACHAILVMYPSDEDKSAAFSSLRDAFSLLALTADAAYDQLTDPTPDISEAVEAALVESAEIVMLVRSLVFEGIDPEIPLEDVSYDLLDRMDLGSLLSAAEDLQSAQP
jgi:hypothetical protein